MEVSSKVLIGFIAYDDGCSLLKYACNNERSEKTKTAESMAKLNIVIDQMHMKGHIDAWCKKTCDLKLFPEIDKVKIILKRTCVMYMS